MMNFMTGIMGILFWHQPSGLSLYFIASSLWSISERKLLGTTTTAPDGTATLAAVLPEEPAATTATTPPATRPKPRPGSTQTSAQAAPDNAPKGFFQRLMIAAEEMQKKAEQAQRQAESQRNRDEGKGKKR
jgi:membrane protein insertase Oxa1/YidC/SpoIIIJ